MGDAVIFDFDEKPVRVAIIDGEPWFVARDVCACLDIENASQAASRLDDDERKGIITNDTLGKNPQQMICVNEPGVYNLVFTSRTEAATKFKRWLAHEVLPALRRTGTYDMTKGVANAEPLPETLPEPDGVDALDIDDIRKCYSILELHRRLFGRRSAAELARRLPIPPSAVATFPIVGSIARFAGEMLVQDPEGRTESGDIWRAYLGWCARQGESPVTRTALGRRLRELGWIKLKSNGRCIYGGTALAAPKPAAA